MQDSYERFMLKTVVSTAEIVIVTPS